MKQRRHTGEETATEWTDRETGAFFQVLYRDAPIGLVIVDSHARIVSVNDYMFRYFNLAPKKVAGKRFGNVFACGSVAGSRIQCGNAEPCQQCALRQGIRRILKEKASVRDVVLRHDYIPPEKKLSGVETGEKTEPKWFIVSGSAVTTGGLSYAVLAFADITREKQYEDLLRHRLTLDLRTGTLNPSSLLAAVEEILSGAKRSRAVEDVQMDRLTVCLVDLDDFAAVNDRYGRQAGDRVLDLFMAAARAVLRHNDIIGRYGSDKFMLVLPDAGTDHALNMLNQWHARLNRDAVREIGEPVFFSAGIAETFTGEAPADPGAARRALLENVEACLRDAKRRGKRRAMTENAEMVFT